jgi:hypothetical protein
MSVRACELSKWKEPHYITALAAAYAESGDFDKAVKFQTQAINMKSEYGPVLKEARERLALYRDHKPWQQTIECALRTVPIRRLRTTDSNVICSVRACAGSAPPRVCAGVRAK